WVQRGGNAGATGRSGPGDLDRHPGAHGHHGAGSSRVLGARVSAWLKGARAAGIIRGLTVQPALWSRERHTMVMMKRDLGELLVEKRVITPEQLQKARQAQQTSRQPDLARVLVDLGFVTETQGLQAKAAAQGLQYVD